MLASGPCLTISISVYIYFYIFVQYSGRNNDDKWSVTELSYFMGKVVGVLVGRVKVEGSGFEVEEEKVHVN